MKKFLLLLSLYATGNALAQPCFTNWQYVTPVQIVNPNTSALTDHQVLVTVNTQALIGAGKLNANGSDLRFGTDCCTALCYYIESGLNTATTNVWVKIPSVAANNGSVSIYMYYGNPGAVSEADPSCVFDLWDGFDNNQLNSFAANCGSNTLNYNAGVVTHNWPSDGLVLSNASFPMSTVYTAEADVTGATGEWPGVYWLKESTTYGYANLMGFSQFRISKSGQGGSYYCQGHNWASATLNYSSVVGTWSITWIGTGNIQANFPSIGVVNSTDTEHARDANLRLAFGGISSGTGSMSINWIRVRKYAATAPVVNIGTESPTSFAGVNITASSPVLCEGQQVSLDAGSGLSSYAWSTMENTQSINVNAGGWYSVVGYDVAGCLSEDSIEIVEYPAPNVDLGPNMTVCPDILVDLDAGPGFVSYDWSSGGSAQVETVSGAGQYTVVVTDGNGCSNADTIEILTFPGSTANFSFTTTNLLADFNDLSSNSGNIASWMWDFGDGGTSTAQDPTHTYTTGGTFTVCLTVTTNDGCTHTYCTDVFVSDVGLSDLTMAYFETYPNPASSELVVVSSWNESLSYELISSSGSLISTGTLKSGKNTLQVGHLEPGIYVIRTHDVNLRFVKK